jgi:hypothetical protein
VRRPRKADHATAQDLELVGQSVGEFEVPFDQNNRQIAVMSVIRDRVAALIRAKTEQIPGNPAPPPDTLEA